MGESKRKPLSQRKITPDDIHTLEGLLTAPVSDEQIFPDDELKAFLNRIYVAGTLGIERNLNDDVEAVRRLV